MKTLKNLERMQQLHALIEKECTGSPTELADKLKISERSIYLLLEQLRDFDAQVAYNRSRKTYYYKEEFQLAIGISVSVINQNGTTDLFGGSYFNNEG
jgi:transcriptional antiterminator